MPEHKTVAGMQSPPNEDIMALAMDEHEPFVTSDCDRGEVSCTCGVWPQTMSLEDWYVHLKVAMTEAWTDFYWRKRQRRG